MGKSASTLQQEKRQQWQEKAKWAISSWSHLVALCCKHRSWSLLCGCRAHSMHLFLEKWPPPVQEGNSSPPRCTRWLPTLIGFIMAFRDLQDLPLGFVLSLYSRCASPAPPHLPPALLGPLHFLPSAQDAFLQRLLKADSFSLLLLQLIGAFLREAFLDHSS